MAVVLSLVTAIGGIARAGATFDDLSLAADSYWNGSDGSGGFYSGGIWFNNNYNSAWDSWDGFAYSNMTDTTTAGYTNQYSVYTGSAYEGQNFGVGYYSTFSGVTTILTFGGELAPENLKMTNTTYAALSMRDGDGFADPMAEGDWYKVILTGKDSTGAVTGTPIEVTLGQYAVGGSLTIADQWLDVDLTPLGSSVETIEITTDSYDASVDGRGSWPDYFAIDNVVPEPATTGLLSFVGLVLLRRRKKSSK